ncbi:MAG: 50S ribosomal protein L6 [Candidatus Micrarchaeota archaeon]|nr:50S ribosomal protein L6 [Candidatus Micrarchaeota archaeon]
MYEIEIPSGTTVQFNEGEIAIKGKLGSTRKKFNVKLNTYKQEGSKITIGWTKNKKLVKKAELAATATSNEVRDAIKNVNEGIETNMKVLYAHFPMSLELKGRSLHLKNVFGEKVPRTADIVGDTKIEIKGQDVKVKGVDRYDVGQTIANIRKACKARGYDTRVFQDGIYISREE